MRSPGNAAGPDLEAGQATPLPNCFVSQCLISSALPLVQVRTSSARPAKLTHSPAQKLRFDGSQCTAEFITLCRRGRLRGDVLHDGRERIGCGLPVSHIEARKSTTCVSPPWASIALQLLASHCLTLVPGLTLSWRSEIYPVTGFQ